MGEKLRELMNKVEPWQWAAGLVVAALGIFAFFKKKNTVQTVPVTQLSSENVPSQSTGDLQTVADNIGSILYQQDTQLQEISGKLVTMQNTFDQTRTEQDTKIEKAFTTIEQQSDTFNNSFNQAVNSFNSALVQTDRQVNEASRSYETNIMSVGTVVKNEVPVVGQAYKHDASGNKVIVGTPEPAPVKQTKASLGYTFNENTDYQAEMNKLKKAGKEGTPEYNQLVKEREQKIDYQGRYSLGIAE
jgi:hypothetical protein